MSGAGDPKPVAAVITEWRTNSHADVLLSRLLEPEAWGHARPFGLKLVSVYADQCPENDLCRAACGRHGIPIFPTVTGAGYHGWVGIEYEGGRLSEPEGIKATKKLLDKLRDQALLES